MAFKEDTEADCLLDEIATQQTNIRMVGALRSVQAHMEDRRSLLIGFRGRGFYPMWLTQSIEQAVIRLGSLGKGRV